MAERTINQVAYAHAEALDALWDATLPGGAYATASRLLKVVGASEYLSSWAPRDVAMIQAVIQERGRL